MHQPARRAALAALVALGSLANLPAFAQQAFPSKPVRFIVPYAPGGTTDLVARVVGQRVSEILGQPVVIENRGGAGGNIGVDAVAKSAPDGYTIGMGAVSTNAVNPYIYKSMPFDPTKDFSAVSLLGTSSIVVTVPASSPIKSIADLIAEAKKTPNMPFATAGAGTSQHLAAELLAQMSGASFSHVPYKGSAPALTDMLNGSMGLMYDQLAASLPHIRAGKLRAIAVAGGKRAPLLPDVPTIAEQGYPGFAVEPWFGVFGPAKMDGAAQAALHKAYEQALNDPAIKQKLTEAGFAPEASTPEALAARAGNDFQRLGDVVKRAKITVD